MTSTLSDLSGFSDFSDTAAQFEKSPGGTDDFKRLYKKAFELMKRDAENAAVYFVIGVAAHAYVIQYEDQAVTAECAEAAKSALVRFCRKAVQALTAEPATRLALLGEIASEYQFDITGF